MLHSAAVYWQLPLRTLHPKPAHLPARTRSECGLTAARFSPLLRLEPTAIARLLRLSVVALSAAASLVRLESFEPLWQQPWLVAFGRQPPSRLVTFGCLLWRPDLQQCCHHSSSSVLVTIGTPEELRLPITVVSTQLEDRARVVFDIHLRA